MKIQNGLLAFTVKYILFVFGLALLAFYCGARINHTESLPIGLYWKENKPVELNDYVTFCPTDNFAFQEARRRGYITIGNCDGNYGELMKKVTGVSGDIITSNKEGVFVNGNYIKNSKPIISDVIPFLSLNEYVLLENELLLMSDYNPFSFDARYFGIIDRKQISDVVIPILTEGE